MDQRSIAVIGTGNIGGTLGRKWAAAGHEVAFGVRDASSPRHQALVEGLESAAAVTTVADAVRTADVVVFAIPGAAMADTVRGLAADLGDKIVIDATNNLGGGPMNSHAVLAAEAPSARAYRAFNSLGWENFADPVFDGRQADLFYSGPDDTRGTVERLIGDIGLRPVRVGDRDQVQLVDAVAGLWFALALQQGRGRHLAFKMLTR